MKKLLVILVTVMAFSFIGSAALACMWDGYWGGPMGAPMMGGYYPGVASGGSYQNFLNDTAKLRQELAAKQAEYNALMAQANPDPKKAGKLSQDIVSLHDQLRAKAQTYNLSAPGPRGGHYNPLECPMAIAVAIEVGAAGKIQLGRKSLNIPPLIKPGRGAGRCGDAIIFHTFRGRIESFPVVFFPSSCGV